MYLYASPAKSVKKYICLQIKHFIIIDALQYKYDYDKGDIKIPKDLQNIDVEALSARNRMKFFQAVSERAGVATQRVGMSLTL